MIIQNWISVKLILIGINTVWMSTKTNAVCLSTELVWYALFSNDEIINKPNSTQLSENIAKYKSDLAGDESYIHANQSFVRYYRIIDSISIVIDDEKFNTKSSIFRLISILIFNFAQSIAWINISHYYLIVNRGKLWILQFASSFQQHINKRLNDRNISDRRISH